MDSFLWCPLCSTQASVLVVVPEAVPHSSHYLSPVLALILLYFISEIFRDQKHAALRACHCQMLRNWTKTYLVKQDDTAAECLLASEPVGSQEPISIKITTFLYLVVSLAVPAAPCNDSTTHVG